MNEYIKSLILKETGASSLFEKEMIQQLWSGYGRILRVGLKNAQASSVVIKQVKIPTSDIFGTFFAWSRNLS